MRSGAIVAIVLILAAGAGASPAATSVREVDFRTPSGNIRCGIGSVTVSCVVLSERIPRPYKQGVDYHHWTLDARIGVIDDFGPAVWARTYRVLAYGRKLRVRAITCVSREIGLRCTSLRGHGFFLSRAHQRAW
jgi:hypothetical protein